MGESVIAQIPTSFYVVAGGLVLANLGTVVTILYGIGKLIWFIAKLESRVGVIEVEHTKDLNAAFTKLRDLEEKINQGVNQ